MNGVSPAALVSRPSMAAAAPGRFVFLNSAKVWGGEERFVVDLAAGLKAAGREVLICGREKGEFLRRAEASGLAGIPLYGSFDYDPRPLWKLPDDSGDEIFVGITPRDFKQLRLLAYFRSRAKFIWHLGVCYPAQNREYRWLLKSERIGLVVPSRFLKSEIVRRFPELQGRISVIPNGVVIPGVDVNSAREKLGRESGVSPQKLFLGVFSRLTSGKGHSMLFRALKQARDKGIDFHLWILGTGERERFENEAAELGLNDRVDFAGYRADIIPWMAGVDAVLLPSEKESFPYVILEGMALGKPVLASRVGGIPEMIQNGKDGILLPPEDAGSWAEAIVELSNNPGKRQDMGRLAKLAVEHRFSLQQMVDDFLALAHENSAVDRA